MKYLDEEIILTFNNLPITQIDQSYTYRLYQNNTVVFIGTVFKYTSDRTLYLNVTELLQSMHFQNDAIEKPLKNYNKPIPDGVIDNIHATLHINSNTYTSQTEAVAFIYRYPRYMSKLNNLPMYPPGYQYVGLTNMNQGTNNSNVQKVLLPRIPFLGTNEYGFGTVYEQHNYASPCIYYSGDIYGTVPLNCSNGTNIWYSTCNNMNISMIKQSDMLDQNNPCLVSGQIYNGNAGWGSAISGGWINTNNQPSYISICNSNLQNLGTSIDLRSLTPGHHDFSFTFRGNQNFYAVKFGTNTNNLLIPVILGKEEIFQDYALRTFTVSVTLTVPVDKINDKYMFNNLKIYYNPTNRTAISLGMNLICDIDLTCAEDYYLQWIDRYGSFQSQPFKERAKYTEKIESLEIQNYSGERRKTYFKTQGTFQINSGYIKESVYPIYESIYTSPLLLLYDVKNNKSYNVICTDTSYEEKTYRNNKALISLQLNLEINKAQSKIY